ncbi:WD40 repeat domain-containing protein [Cysteiniphilum sp. 6C5]
MFNIYLSRYYTLVFSLIIIFLTFCHSVNAQEKIKLPTSTKIYAFESAGAKKEYVGITGGLALGDITDTGIEFTKIYNQKTIPSIVGQTVKAIAKSGDLIAIGSNKGLSVCSINSGMLLKQCTVYTQNTIPKMEHITVIDLILVDDILYIANYHGGLLVAKVDLKSHQLLSVKPYNQHTVDTMMYQPVKSIALTMDKKKIAFATRGGGLGVASIDDNHNLSHINYSQPGNSKFSNDVHGVAISPKGTVAVATSFGLYLGRLTDVNTFITVTTYNKNDTNILSNKYNAITFNHDGTMLAAATMDKGVMVAKVDDQNNLIAIKFYNTQTTPALSLRSINAIAFSENEKQLYVGSDSSTMTIIDL